MGRSLVRLFDTKLLSNIGGECYKGITRKHFGEIPP